MTGYVAIVAARFKTLLQYRAAALGGVFTQTFFGGVRVMILAAFYRASSASAPMDLRQVIDYVWLGQATLLVVPWRVDADIAQQIRTGTVVYELTRPLDLYATWFARTLAWRTAPVFMRMLPLFVVAMGLVPLIGGGTWGLAPPASAAAAVLWALAFVGAVLVSCALTTLMNTTMLWTISGDGVPMLIAAGCTMFGGLVIPLPLFPDWAHGILYALPFASMIDLPSRIYTGNISPADGVWVLAHQLAWTIALVALGRFLLARGLRRLVVQGG